MNYSFQSLTNSESPEYLPFFYGYQMISCASFTFAICHNEEMAEELKMFHLYARDWLKNKKITISELFNLIRDHFDKKLLSVIPALLILEGNKKGTVHILATENQIHCWLLRNNHLINMGQPRRLDRIRLRWHKMASDNKIASDLVSFRCKLAKNDAIYFQLADSRSNIAKSIATNPVQLQEQGVIAKIKLSAT